MNQKKKKRKKRSNINDEVSESCLIPKMIKKIYNQGKNNPNYKEGKYYIPHYCIDCKKELSKNHNSIRCLKCFIIFRRGINHSNYIKGLPKCINCDIELKNYKSRRCYSCENKRKHKLGIINSKGKKNNRYGKLLIPHWKKYKNIWMRSSWEIKYNTKRII